MSDFHQTGAITTFHNVTRRDENSITSEVAKYAKARPVTLVLPSLFSELEGPALEKIVDVLVDLPWINNIYIGLDRASEEQYRYAKDFFSRLPQHHRVLWNDGPRMQAIHEKLASENVAPTELGKGRNAWYLMGYAQAMPRGSQVLALHDCDIITYDGAMLARLLYPVINPDFKFVFSKGYYARIADGKLNGRVVRLLVAPLLQALEMVVGPHKFIRYLAAFRYPLSGEFAMNMGIVPEVRIPSDWGLEIGFLSEVRRTANTAQIAQVDLADIYDHKHQDLSEQDATSGLSRMSIDIIKAVLRKLATEGVIISDSTLRALKASYYRTALDMIEAYAADARFNGARVDRHREEKAVELFASNIMEAGETFLRDPSSTPFIPNWRRIRSAYPDIFHDLAEAVKDDMEEV
ncbi:glycosyl transferase [Notoacmeibacter sp. MSK16QG-6]|uniref:glycosyl transferase n=1 Tax=Notoacmeibacter sp. MSK16QG-6 TaxID=2957982 RepID=UPI00209D3F9D|nr:glycosyl transferase [Notoacmeibacter sp. MSK16QG-6]MCP1199722.1 glycosyl transferase [Notoacmeibacter sp. MSK16QG-6]